MPKISKKAIREARWNTKQLIIDPLASAGASERKKQVTTTIEYKTTIYYCPFCLFYGALHEFQFKTPKGKTSKKFRCPECKSEMLGRTLTEKKTAEEYATWVFWYSADGFWQKCPFKTWKERLYKLGMAKKFWETYKRMKGTTEYKEGDEGDIQAQAEEYQKAGVP